MCYLEEKTRESICTSSWISAVYKQACLSFILLCLVSILFQCKLFLRKNCIQEMRKGICVLTAYSVGFKNIFAQCKSEQCLWTCRLSLTCKLLILFSTHCIHLWTENYFLLHLVKWEQQGAGTVHDDVHSNELCGYKVRNICSVLFWWWTGVHDREYIKGCRKISSTFHPIIWGSQEDLLLLVWQ